MFAIVEPERKETWTWFIMHLNNYFVGCLQKIVVMSDMDKGLLAAISKLIQMAEHMVCIRNFWKNFKKNYPVKFYEHAVWGVAKAFSKLVSIRQMSLIATKCNFSYEMLRKISKYNWSRHQFESCFKNHYIINNLAESFNAWIVAARHLPTIELVDKMREKLMKMFQERREREQENGRSSWFHMQTGWLKI